MIALENHAGSFPSSGKQDARLLVEGKVQLFVNVLDPARIRFDNTHSTFKVEFLLEHSDNIFCPISMPNARHMHLKYFTAMALILIGSFEPTTLVAEG